MFTAKIRVSSKARSILEHFDGGAGNGSDVPSIRVSIAWVIIAGLQDIFKAFMIFLVLDEEADIVCDESR